MIKWSKRVSIHLLLNSHIVQLWPFTSHKYYHIYGLHNPMCDKL